MSVQRLLVIGAVCTGLSAIAIATPGLVTSTWIGPSGDVWSNPANWDTGNVPDGSGDLESAIVDGSAKTDVEARLDISVTLQSLTIGAGDSVGVNNARVLRVDGPILNDGLLGIDATTSAGTALRLGANPVVADGTGVLRMSSPGKIDGQVFGFRMTNGMDHEIRGSGNVGVGVISVDNLGAIVADVPGETLDLQYTSSGTNDGLYRAENGGRLRLLGSHENTGGAIEAGDGSVVELDPATIVGGTISAEGTGTVEINANTAVLSDLTNSATIVVANAFDPRVDGTLVNDGVIDLQGTSSPTNFVVGTNPVTLTGSGELGLNGPSAGITGAIFGNRLINDADHLIRGEGTIGQGIIDVTNLGLIVGDVTGSTLILQPTNFVDNDSTIRAENGSTMILRGNHQNQTGRYEAVDGSTLRLEAPLIEGGEIAADPTSEIVVQTNSTILRNVTATGRIRAVNSVDPRIDGTLTHDDVFELEGTSSPTQLTVGTASVTLSGGGEVLMTGPSAAISGATFGNELIVAPDHVVRGRGNIGVGIIDVTNQGLIVADVEGASLILQPTNFVDNDSTIRAENGSTLVLRGNHENVDGVYEAVDGSVIRLEAPSLDRGIFTADETSEIRVVLNTTTLTDVILEGRMVVQNSFDPRFAGTFTNEGVVELQGSSSPTQLLITTNPMTLTGGGELVMVGPAAEINGTTFGHTLVNAADHTIRGRGMIGASVIDIDNLGLLTADVTGDRLTLQPTDRVRNEATIRAENGALLRLRGRHENLGLYEAIGGSTIEIDAARIEGGLYASDETSEYRVLGNTTTFADAGFDANVVVQNSFDPRISGTLTNEGVFDVQGLSSPTVLSIETNPTTLAGAGEVILTGPSCQITGQVFGHRLVNAAGHTLRGRGNIGVAVINMTNAGTLLADGAGTLTLQPNADFLNTGSVVVTGDGRLDSISGFFENQGDVLIDAANLLDRTTGDYVQTAGTTTVDGELEVDAGVVDVVGGLLEGSGLVDADVENAGAVGPGRQMSGLGTPETGRLDIEGDYTQAGTGALVIEIGGTMPESGFDVLSVTGTATLAGLLQIELVDGFVPPVGQTFTIIDAAEVVGEFSLASCRGRFTIQYGETDVTITAIPSCNADVNCSATVDTTDLLVLLAEFGQPGGPADLNLDGIVDTQDLLILLAAFGPCP